MKLAFNLKPSASTADVLVDADEVFFGRDGAERLRTGLRNNVFATLCLDMMRQARLRLDLMSILYARRLFLKFDITRYLLIDSSPQWGYDFKCVRDDGLMIPKETCANIIARVGLDIVPFYSPRICPLNTLRTGRGSAMKTSAVV